MPINFPDSPVVNDVYSLGGTSWVWNGASWVNQGTVTQGAQGIQGVQGITGTGSQGIQGITGTGTQGVQGVQGTSGSGGGGSSRMFFTFGGTGTPTAGTDKTPWLRVPSTGANARFIHAQAKSAPGSGGLNMTIEQSTTGAFGTWSTVGVANVPNFSTVANPSAVSVALVANNVLRISIDSNNGAADWTVIVEAIP